MGIYIPQPAYCKLYLRGDTFGGNILTDLSGNGNNHTYTGTPLLVQGATGPATYLDAATLTSAARSNDTDFNVINRIPFSFTCWVKASGIFYLLTRYNAGVVGNWYFYYSGNIAVSREASPYVPRNSTGIISYGTWGHMGITYDGSTTYFYINGRLDSTAADTRTATGGSMPTGIGCLHANGSPSSRTTGSFQNMTFHNGIALTADEIRQLYAQRFIGRGQLLC